MTTQASNPRDATIVLLSEKYCVSEAMDILHPESRNQLGRLETSGTINMHFYYEDGIQLAAEKIELYRFMKGKTGYNVNVDGLQTVERYATFGSNFLAAANDLRSIVERKSE